MSELARIAGVGVSVWADAAVTSPEAAAALLDLGVERVIVGLETLPSFSALERICQAAGGGAVAFSCDLHRGRALSRAGACGADEPVELVAARGAEAGATATVVIDLARVGAGEGLDFRLIDRIRATLPETVLVAGGGVRDASDLTRLANCGCDGALVGTALYQGRITAHDVHVVNGLRAPIES